MPFFIVMGEVLLPLPEPSSNWNPITRPAEAESRDTDEVVKEEDPNDRETALFDDGSGRVYELTLRSRQKARKNDERMVERKGFFSLQRSKRSALAP